MYHTDVSICKYRSLNYATLSIIDALKGARLAKGLSQRALSGRTGVPQSHVSKIENGGADIRLSSLIELARALDLELRLIPRKAVPAVDSVVRSTAPTVVATPASRDLNRTLDVVRGLRIAYPDLGELKEIQESIRILKGLGNVDKELKTVRDTGKLVRKLQRASMHTTGTGMRHSQKSTEMGEAVGVPPEQLQALRTAARALEDLRNRLLDAVPSPSLPKPAYRLDDDGDG